MGHSHNRTSDHLPYQTFKTTGKNGSPFLMLCLVSVVLLVSRGYSQVSPCINQSPRDLTLHKAELDAKPPVPGLDYNYTSATTVMNPTGAITVEYQGQTLRLCDRHYHVPVENLQGCKDEKVGTPNHNPPDVGQWIEFHSVYAAEVDSAAGCAEGPDRNLACCKKPPFVVRAFSAKVTAAPAPPPIMQPTLGSLAEWTGSNTSPDAQPGGCKPLPAQWSFRFGCEFTVSQSQFDPDFHPHGAREVQPPKRLSPDLTVVGTAPEQKLACREVETPLLQASNANTVCQATCKNPLNLFTNGNWRNVPATNPTHGLCTCCPLPRLQ
jgi:hypothetical protein